MVWFRCQTVDLRVMDIASVTSKVKSWLYQDQLLKPEEMVAYRPIKMGGLQLHNVKIKALSSFIRTFMETAIHPDFHHSLFHSLLYRVHVLGDESISNPPKLPPYFPTQLFDIIRKIKNSTPLNIATMTTSQWYRVILEDEVTMYEPEDSPREYNLTKAELASPNTDWVTSWARARLRGLGTEGTSFLWKMLHQLLPTEERLARCKLNTTANCKLCPLPVTADQTHCLLDCVSTKEMGDWLLSLIRLHDQNVTPEGLLRLEFQCDDSMEMPLVWITAQTLLQLWGVRAKGKKVDKYATRATLENKITLLRETRYQNEYEAIKDMFDKNM